MIQIKNIEKINVKNLFLVVQKYSLCFLTKEQVNFFGDAEQNKINHSTDFMFICIQTNLTYELI